MIIIMIIIIRIKADKHTLGLYRKYRHMKDMIQSIYSYSYGYLQFITQTTLWHRNTQKVG